jgi:hypothetical protein
MKNLFNKISQTEKQRILEMHSGKKTVSEDRNVKNMSDIDLQNKFTDHIGGRYNSEIESEDEFMDKRFRPGVNTFPDTEFGKEQKRRREENPDKYKPIGYNGPKRLPDDVRNKLYRKHKMMWDQHDNEDDWATAFSSGIDKVKDESNRWRENPNYDFGFED